MNNRIKYESKKIEEFMEAYNEFNSDYNGYFNDLNVFNTELNTLIESEKSSNSNSNRILKNENATNNSYYLLTKESLIFDLPNSSNETNIINININLTPYRINKIDIDDKEIQAYYIPELVNKHRYEDNLTNTIAQVGLGDLQYNDEDNSSVRIIPQGKNSSLSADNICDYDNVLQCDSYAKMTNKSYYGLNYNKDDTNKCNCYVFDTLEGIPEVTKMYNLKSRETDYSDLHDINYFGILYDSNLYGLKDKIYRKNFKDFYIPKEEKMNNVTNLNINNCNPFTGNGPYNIQVNSLDNDTVCKFK